MMATGREPSVPVRHSCGRVTTHVPKDLLRFLAEKGAPDDLPVATPRCRDCRETMVVRLRDCPRVAAA